MRKIVIISVLALVLLVACQSDQAATSETPLAPSTPLDVLLASDMHQSSDRPTPVPESVIADADAEYLLLANIYERITPSVVSIEVTTVVDRGVHLTDISNGSGFVYDQNGYIITNAHVANDARAIRVTFDDGYVVDAELVGADVYSDIAVVKVDTDSDRLLPLSFGDSDLVHVGQRAIAIGNPFGLSSSMTVGIVSAVGRQLSSAFLIDNTISPGFQNPHIIQVDTDINPGNSGGPLINSLGEVIGINTFIFTESGGSIGLGFAVPVARAQWIIREVREYGYFRRAYVGFGIVEVTEVLAQSLGLPSADGFVVRDVIAGSPAHKAGLRPYDVITSINGVALNDADTFNRLVYEAKVGTRLDFEAYRDGEGFSGTIELEEDPRRRN